MSAQWYVIQTIPLMETSAQKRLIHGGYEIFSPVIRKTIVRCGKKRNYDVPMFRGYVFTELDLEVQPWTPINRLPGVRGLLCGNSRADRDNRPWPISRAWIEALKAEGPIIDVSEYSPFVVGEVVRFKSGPMAMKDEVYRVAKLEPGRRVLIMLRMLGAEKPVKVSTDWLEKAS